MKRRQLKKKVNYLCSELFAECIALRHYNLVANKEDADNVMKHILQFHQEMVSRISHVEPGNTKGFFVKFRQDVKAHVEDITGQFQNLL